MELSDFPSLLSAHWSPTYISQRNCMRCVLIPHQKKRIWRRKRKPENVMSFRCGCGHNVGDMLLSCELEPALTVSYTASKPMLVLLFPCTYQKPCDLFLCKVYHNLSLIFFPSPREFQNFKHCSFSAGGGVGMVQSIIITSCKFCKV